MKLPIILIILLISAFASAEERWAVLPTNGVNVHEDFSKAVDALAVNALEEAGCYVLDLTNEAVGEDLPARALADGVGQIMQFEMIRMGERVKLTAKSTSSSSGEVLRRQSLSAGSPDDLDKVVERLVDSIRTGQQVRENQSIYDVTDEEQAALKKKRATNYWGLKLGGMNYFSDPQSSGSIIPQFAAFWLYDPRTFLAEIDLGFGVDRGDGVAMGLNLSAYYPFTDSDFCPYLGGGLGFSARTHEVKDSEVDHDTASGVGITANIAAGVMLGRTSSVSLRADVRFFQDTFETGTTYANGLVYTLGIGF